MSETCAECEQEITDDESSTGYQVYDPNIRQALGMGGSFVLHFHTEPDCLSEWKRKNSEMLGHSQR